MLEKILWNSNALWIIENVGRFTPSVIICCILNRNKRLHDHSFMITLTIYVGVIKTDCTIRSLIYELSTRYNYKYWKIIFILAEFTDVIFLFCTDVIFTHTQKKSHLSSPYLSSLPFWFWLKHKKGEGVDLLCLYYVK